MGKTLVFVALSLGLAGAAVAQHAEDLWIAVNGAGRLIVSRQGFAPEEGYVYLPSSGGLLPGFAGTEPGFDKMTTPAPELDEYVLAPGHDVWLEVVEVEPAFRGIVLGAGPGGAPLYLQNPPDAYELSDPASGALHEHVVFHVNSADPAYDAGQCVWRATFKLRDEGTSAHDDSAPFTLRFSVIPVRYEQEPPTPATGDFDASGAADAGDWPAFAECLGGVAVAPAPNEPAVTACEVECLNAFDFDDDRDVDLADYAAFQRVVRR